MAGVRVADLEGHVHQIHLRLAQQPSGFIHPQVDVVARGRDDRGGLEQAVEMKPVQPGYGRMPF